MPAKKHLKGTLRRRALARAAADAQQLGLDLAGRVGEPLPDDPAADAAQFAAGVGACRAFGAFNRGARLLLETGGWGQLEKNFDQGPHAQRRSQRISVRTEPAEARTRARIVRPSTSPERRAYGSPGLGRLKNGNPAGDFRLAPRCGAKTRAGDPCRQPAMANRRCRLHGGKATGPRTAAGRARCAAARVVHGERTATVRAIRAETRRAVRAVDALVALTVPERAPKVGS